MKRLFIGTKPYDYVHIPGYVILIILFASISISTAFAFTSTDGLLSNVVGNSIVEAKADGGNAVVKMTDKGTASYAFTVFDNTQRFDITDINQGKVRLSVINNGNVGIGTTSPTQTLYVKGNIGLSGNIIPDSDLCIGTCP